MKAPCTKQQVIDYAKEQGYTIDIVDFWTYWEQREWKYGKPPNLRELKIWKAYVTRSCDKGWHGAKPIPKPKPLPEPRPNITPATDEQKARIKAGMKRIGKKPDYGFRSNRVLEQKRQKAVKKLEQEK